jgi:hypothetical protein
LLKTRFDCCWKILGRRNSENRVQQGVNIGDALWGNSIRPAHRLSSYKNYLQMVDCSSFLSHLHMDILSTYIYIMCFLYIYAIYVYIVILYYIVLYCIILYYFVLYCIVLYCIVLYCIILYYIILYCIILDYIILYYIVLYCVILYYIRLTYFI